MATCSRFSTFDGAPYQSNRKRFGNQARLLALVDSERSNRRTGTGVAARISDFAFKKRAQARLDKGPGTHILRFLLAPDQLGRFGKDRKSTRLNSSHRCISYAVFCL